MLVSLTITTINIPEVVSLICKLEIPRHMHLQIILIGDVKTPPSIISYLSQFTQNSNISIRYLDIESQNEEFANFPDLLKHLPLNSFSRRNLGDLLAIKDKSDVIVRIDDDNFPCSQDFIIKHVEALQSKEVNVVEDSECWFNICEVLIDDQEKHFYPRGYPYHKRFLDSNVQLKKHKVRIGVNAGLWIGDPDIDAITRLVLRPNIVSLDKNLFGETFALAKGTWSPINTQNTSYIADLARISFVSPHVGRFDDIFTGYIMRAIMDNNDYLVAYGLPLVKQIRNVHDLWSDESLERFGNTKGEKVIDFCQDFSFSSHGVMDNYLELIAALEIEFKDLDPIRLLCQGAKIWADSIATIQN